MTLPVSARHTPPTGTESITSSPRSATSDLTQLCAAHRGHPSSTSRDHGRALKQPVHRPHLECPLSLSKYQFRISLSSYCAFCATVLHCLAAAAATTLPRLYRCKSHRVHPAAVFPTITMAATAATTATTATAAAVPITNAGTLPVNEFPIARDFRPTAVRRPSQPPRHRLPTIAIAIAGPIL